jgi:hypothetical protein
MPPKILTAKSIFFYLLACFQAFFCNSFFLEAFSHKGKFASFKSAQR